MNCYHASLRAAAAATGVVLSAGVVAASIGALEHPRPVPLLEILQAIPVGALLVTVYAFSFTLVFGTLGHWLLRRLNCRGRSHYVVCGAVLGWVTPWLLLGRPADWRWTLLAGAVFAAAGAVAAATFWRLHVRGA